MILVARKSIFLARRLDSLVSVLLPATVPNNERQIYRRREAARSVVDRLDRRSAWCERAGADKTGMLKSLREALIEALEFNREEARRAAEGDYVEEAVMV